MKGLFCLSLIATLASGATLPIHTQGQKDPLKKTPPKDFTNSLGMKFVWIPPGTFLMGSPKEEGKRDGDEIQHKVTLTKGFYMGVYTVTQEQWQAIMGKNPSRCKGDKNLPVDNVSWQDCQEFCKKLRAKDQRAYRLPTEAEWEYACGAGTTTPFHFGPTISTDQVNYNGNFTYGKGKKGVFRGKSTPVGRFPPNAWGLYDMHGNVSQWCQDWYGEYPQKDVSDPHGPEKETGVGTGRVRRGGTWNFPPHFCRSACRGGPVGALRHFNCGLRLCADVP
jgi:formylglycine-generating enzyme required for sulfatase activity